MWFFDCSCTLHCLTSSHVCCFCIYKSCTLKLGSIWFDFIVQSSGSMSIYLSLSAHPSVYVPTYPPYRQPYSSQAKANWSERSRLHQRQLCRRKHWNQTMPFWPPPLHPFSSLHSSSSSDWFIFLHRRATSIGGHTLSHKVHWSPLWMTFGGWYQSTRVEPL